VIIGPSVRSRGGPTATVPRVIVVPALVALVLLTGLAVFQVALIAGAPLGHFAWGGQYRVLPSKLRIGSAVSLVLYALFALVIWGSMTRLSVAGGDAGVDVGIWVLTAYFGAGVLTNAVSRSRPERFLMTPVALVLVACCLVIALQS
jgi:hypothetical protein